MKRDGSSFWTGRGQRLGDLASLIGRKIDLNEQLLTFRSQRTGRDMVIPIAQPFLAYLKKHLLQDADAPVFPKASAQKKEADGDCQHSSTVCSSKRN